MKNAELILMSALSSTLVTASISDGVAQSVITSNAYYFSKTTFSNDEAPSELNLKKEFDNLVEQWRMETLASSIVSSRYRNPSYRKIISMGIQAVPWVLSELRDRPDRWCSALVDLTGERKIENESDSFQSAAEKWLKWGREQGHNV